MVRIITVEREYGSGGADFAHHLAERLGWRLIDQCLVDEIAQRAGVPTATVASCDERLDPWYYRVGKAFWHGSVDRGPAPVGTSDIFDSERMASMVRTYLKDKVAEGNCVVVGRGAAPALVGVPGAFHIFVYASLPRKIRWFKEHFPDQAAKAVDELAETDRRRANYVRRFYDQDWADRQLYQLMLNSCMGPEAMVNATIEAAALASVATSNAVSAR
jgi:cytidylate kinase